MKTEIKTEQAPQAIGPYAQAIEANGFLFVSGQLPIDPVTGEFADGGIKEKTEQSIRNIEAILKKAGSGLENVVKTTVFLDDIADFGEMNEVYKEWFKGVCPARSAVEVANLPKQSLIEIEVIAVK